MTFAQKLLMIIGIIFTSVGAFILALTLGLNLLLHDGALFMILPIAFWQSALDLSSEYSSASGKSPTYGNVEPAILLKFTVMLKTLPT